MNISEILVCDTISKITQEYASNTFDFQIALSFMLVSLLLFIISSRVT